VLIIGATTVPGVAPQIAPGIAHADSGDGDGTFGGDGTSASISVWANSSTDGVAVDADDPDGPRRWTRRVTPDPGQPSSPIGGICNPGNDPLTGLPRFGWPYTVETIDTTTGAVVSTQRICVPLDPATPGAPTPPAIAEPPTYGEIWKAAAITPPTIGVNPTVEGVTGLTTRLWANGLDTVQIAVTIRGYRAVGVARRVGYWFSPGDGPAVIRRVEGGSAAAPVGHHVYESRGEYVLGAGALWTATVTVSGPDIPATAIDLGEALVVVSRDYRVVEVRSRLTR
jgi:hypothetical protein